MPLKTIESTMNVLDAARMRVRNVFSNGCRVYMSFSAGKDSLCMSHVVYDLIHAGAIDPKQLVVIFIDEEAIYPSMYQMALRWRERFIAVGSEFRWYCLPVRQVSILHHLQNNEEWITFEPGKEDTWVRQPPPWAITRSPYLHYPGEMNYQTFCETITRDGIQLVGLRADESVQRRQILSTARLTRGNLAGGNKVYPIYDWKNGDVWLYIQQYNLDFPESYIDLYRIGVPRFNLRLCNFFAAESIAGLRYIAETDAKLWEQIEKREPNAYLTLLYWDSELFKRSTRKRRELEGEPTKDYKALCMEMLIINPGKYFTNPSTQRTAAEYRKFLIANGTFMQPWHFQRMHDALIAGDPKLRTLRAMYTNVFGDYTSDAVSGKGADKV
mgnify:CR=1 FL=1